MNGSIRDRLRPLASSPPRSSRSARAVADDLVATYEAIDPRADKVQWAHQQAAAQSVGPGADAALHAASRSIAAAIDADAAFFDRNAYHNRQHYCEVLLASGFLADLHDLSAADAQLLLLAALVHDFVHDGRPARGFRLERRSVERATPYLSAAAATDTRQCDRLAALVLATEPVDGVRLALAAGRFHTSGAAMPTIPEPAPELAQLAADPGLARLALLLCEADLLPSVGLTYSHAMRVQDRLAREWGQPLSVRDKLNFVDSVLACGVVGDFFAPNAAAVRGELARRVDEPASG